MPGGLGGSVVGGWIEDGWFGRFEYEALPVMAPDRTVGGLKCLQTIAIVLIDLADTRVGEQRRVADPPRLLSGVALVE